MNVIVFGCGGVGIAAKEKLEAAGMTVIAFADNNEKKWGTLFAECEVISPDEICTYNCDLIAIGVYKAVETIKKQLTQLGVPENKIIIPITPDRIFPNPIPVKEEELENLDPLDYVSDNTKDYLNKKIVIDDDEFIHKLDDLKKTLKENNIPRKKVCIVGGAVLQAHGLRKSKKFDDIDIIMTSDLREIYGKNLVIVSESAEMHSQNKEEIMDDEIITNRQYHFVFYDLKFACLDIVMKHRKG